jgi:predicted amidohydrolase
LRIGLAHLTLKLMSRKTNYDKVKRAVKEAKTKGAKTVILPSMINLGPILSFHTPAQCKGVIRNHAERMPIGNTVNMLTNVAVANGVFIIAGPIVERAGPRVFLTSIAISPTGNIIGKYRKIILNPGDKNLGISSGKQPQLINIKESYGLLLENDVLYPEIARALTIMGSTLLLAFLRVEPVFDNRLERILEARSIENNLPLIALGGAAKNHHDIIGEAPSLIFDPSDGLLEKITIESKIGTSTLGDEDKIVLLELQNYVSKSMANHKESIMNTFTIIYKNLKQLRASKKKRKTQKQTF